MFAIIDLLNIDHTYTTHGAQTECNTFFPGSGKISYWDIMRSQRHMEVSVQEFDIL